MKWIKQQTFLALLATLLLGSCNNLPSVQNMDSANLNGQQSPEFNADSAMNYARRQVVFGPRIPGTKAHAACADYLVKFFKDKGANVIVQQGNVSTYDGKTFNLQNIIASMRPKFKKRIMLSAHWDTRPFSDNDPVIANKTKSFEGANDGGSGIAILMEIARDLALKSPDIGVDLVLWDLEDYGNSTDESTWCLGSQYWAKHPPIGVYRPLYCINLDMVGGQNAVFKMDKLSMTYGHSIMQKVWDIGNDLGYSTWFSYQRLQNDIVDDHVYVNKDANISAIDIVDYDDQKLFYKYWHTQGDNMQHIDKKVLKAVGQTVLETLFREARLPI